MSYTESQLKELREKTNETTVGGCFEWDGVRYRVVEDFYTLGCFTCEFRNRAACHWTSCTKRERPDDKHVRFEIAEGGEK